MTTQRRSLGISDRADLNLDVNLSRLNKRLRKSLDHEVILNLATIAENDLFRSSKLMDSQEKMVRNPQNLSEFQITGIKKNQLTSQAQLGQNPRLLGCKSRASEVSLDSRVVEWVRGLKRHQRKREQKFDNRQKRASEQTEYDLGSLTPLIWTRDRSNSGSQWSELRGQPRDPSGNSEPA